MVAQLRKQPSFRIIAHRPNHKPIADRLPSVSNRAALNELEAMTNPRVAQLFAARKKVRPEDIEGGDNNEMIVASFTYSGASRFTDGSYGVYYAGFEFHTAAAESACHTERFLSETNTRPTSVYKRVLAAHIDGSYDDIRGLPETDPIYDPECRQYAAAQAYARGVYSANSLDGIVYRCVRDAGGTCVAAFRPRLISACETAGFLAYTYDGKRIDDMFRIGSIEEITTKRISIKPTKGADEPE